MRDARAGSAEARRLIVANRPDLLSALAHRIGSAITRQSLVDRVLDPDREGTSRTLDVHFSRVRKKLGSEGARIATVWGVGYRLLPS